MRFHRKATIVLSEDDVTSPKQLRFSEDLETLDNAATAILKDGGGQTIGIAASQTDFALPMPQITTGKYLYLYADKAFTLKLNGGTYAMIAKKANELWCDYASAPLISTGADAIRLTFAIAGD